MVSALSPSPAIAAAAKNRQLFTCHSGLPRHFFRSLFWFQNRDSMDKDHTNNTQSNTVCFSLFLNWLKTIFLIRSLIKGDTKFLHSINWFLVYLIINLQLSVLLCLNWTRELHLQLTLYNLYWEKALLNISMPLLCKFYIETSGARLSSPL